MAALIAVYRDRRTADAVAHELHDRNGVAEESLRVAEWRDVQTSIYAEMDAEIAESWASGVYGLVTSEMARGAVLFGALGGAIGLLVGIPLGLLYDGDVSMLTRLAVGALIGFLFGTTVGTLLGGGMSMKSPEEALAGERGVPVVVEDAADELATVMAHYDPIRIDKFEDGRRVATLAAEEPSGVAETVGELVANAEDPGRR